MSLILNGDTGISAVDGTASVPALVGNDTNTGIYFPAADTIGFSEGGVQVGEFDSSANFKFNSGYGSVATAYGCRAWVNFNGTGTVAIRASGNVASITDNGTGDYTVVIDNDMPDANYAVAATGKYIENAGASTVFGVSIANFASNPLAGSVRVVSGQANNSIQFDFLVVCVSIFR
jgi:hypothetical protein